MEMDVRLTVREASDAIHRLHGGPLCPVWAMRRIIDDLDGRDRITVQRAGLYRTISCGDLGVIADEMRRIGRLQREVTPCT